jgi:hypothetical protein
MILTALQYHPAIHYQTSLALWQNFDGIKIQFLDLRQIAYELRDALAHACERCEVGWLLSSYTL